jgi:hypothetical protein
MKKNYLIVAFLALIFSTSIISCSSDDDNNNTNESYGTSTGDYWPMAIGNQWTMKQNGMNDETVKITSTDVFNGITYYKTDGNFEENSLGLEAESWITKKGATYLIKVGDINYSQDGVAIKLQEFEYTVLKDDLPVSGTWTEKTTQDMLVSYLGQTQTLKLITNYTGTILEKNAEAVVNGVKYSDVIKLNLNQNATFEGENINVDTEYWYAKNVGPIKVVSESDGETTESILIDYIINK